MAIGNNPFQRGLSIQVGADTSRAQRNLRGLTGVLGSTRLAALGLGVALAAVAAGGLAKSISAAAEWEEQLVEIAKVTDDATAAELDESLQELSETLPVATNKLADIAEIAGRLGIQGAEDIETFTTTISKLAIATDLSARDAAQDFARLSNALGVPVEQMENMGSAVNTLANNFAASTSEIVASMSRAAPAAAQLGVEFADLAAIQTVLVASGMRVERAGTRMNRAFSKLAQEAPAVAEAIGMTAENFGRLLEEDPTEALRLYLEHLNSIESSQERVNEATELFGSAGAKTVLTLATRIEDLDRAMGEANRSFEEGESLNREYEKASQTFNAEVQRLENSVGNLAREIGEDLLPAMKDLVSATADATQATTDLLEKTDRAGEIGAWSAFVKEGAFESRGFADATDGAAEAVATYNVKVDDAVSAGDGVVRMFDRTTAAIEGVTDEATQAADKVQAFVDTASDLRAGVAQGFGLSDVRQLIEENQPLLKRLEDADRFSVTGPNVDKVIALREAQRLLESGEATDITDLPIDIATTLAGLQAKRVRKRQLFQREIFKRLQERGIQLPQTFQQVQTDVSVDITIDPDAGPIERALVEAADIVIEKETRRTDRLNPHHPIQ